MALADTADIGIAYTPIDAEADLLGLIGGRANYYIPQLGAGLGERLIAATTWAAEHGYTKILLVGSDSPTLPIAYLSEALARLDTQDIVIGPSVDGGYYLIGFSAAKVDITVPHVFEDIAWSTPTVFQETLERVRAVNATLGLLPPWYDVDTTEDLTFLHTHLSAMRLAGEPVQAVRTESLLTQLF